MSTAAASAPSVVWWKEPTKEQWLAYLAAWLGWTLDAFDFTIFLLIMVPISQEFHVQLVSVLAVFTVTLWMRLLGATASGWLADRLGRKTPLMISIVGYSVCNFIAGFRRPLPSCSSSARSSVSLWAPSGRPARRWRWSRGRLARAGS